MDDKPSNIDEKCIHDSEVVVDGRTTKDTNDECLEIILQDSDVAVDGRTITATNDDCLQCILQNTKVDVNGKRLSDLNDDCLECIFERVRDLPSQIQIASCCRRFHAVMTDLWKRQPVHKVLDFNEVSSYLENFEDFKFYLNSLRTHFDTLAIIDDCLNVFLKEMEDIGIQCFPAIDKCQFQDDITECYPDDADVEALSRLVPNLKYLQICVPITGKHLANFQYLEELHLYDGQTKYKEIEAVALREILLKLKHLRVLDLRTFECSHLQLTPEISECSNLEVLKVNLSTLKPMLTQVLQLPQLKQLQVLLDEIIDVSLIDNVDNFDYSIYETQEYHHILQNKAAQIRGMAVDFHYLPVSSTWPDDFGYVKPENLHILALCNYQFSAQDCRLLKCRFDRLEILCLRHSKDLQTNDVLSMLHMCPVLKHLDISYCFNMEKTLLSDILKLLQSEKRTQSLHLYYRMSGLDSEIKKNLSFWNAQKHIKLDSGFPPDSDNGLSYVQRGYAFYF